jgi:hypothetical protein
VGEGGEVPAGAERAVLGDGGGHARVQHRDECLHQFHADPREPHREGLRPDHHHRPHDLRLHERSHPCGVAAQQRVLELSPLRCRDVRRRERAEAGGDPVDRALLVDDPLDVAPGGQDALSRLVSQRNPNPVARHRDYRLEAQTVHARFLDAHAITPHVFAELSRIAGGLHDREVLVGKQREMGLICPFPTVPRSARPGEFKYSDHLQMPGTLNQLPADPVSTSRTPVCRMGR